MNDLDAILNSPLFSARWYADCYPDVDLSGIAAARHCLLVGGPLGRNTSPYSSRRLCPEVCDRAEAAGRNPVLVAAKE